MRIVSEDNIILWFCHYESQQERVKTDIECFWNVSDLHGADAIYSQTTYLTKSDLTQILSFLVLEFIKCLIHFRFQRIRYLLTDTEC